MLDENNGEPYLYNGENKTKIKASRAELNGFEL